MTIIRTINSVAHEFVLTPEELMLAYYEQEHNFDIDDMEDLISFLEDDEVFETYGVHSERFRELEDEMAFEKRQLMDRYDMTWSDARDEAVSRIIEKYKCDNF